MAYFNHLGRLKNSFALLAYHLCTSDTNADIWTIDKIVNLRDEEILGSDWKYDNINDICNSIGNLVVLDIPKKYNSMHDKTTYYNTSNVRYVKDAIEGDTFTYSNWKSRDVKMKELLLSFFKKNEL